MKPYFSVIIPLYNKEKYVSDTIKSVISQTFSDFEVIVINDGSTDLSQKTVEGFEDKRIKLFNLKNSGVSHARNYGVSMSNSDLIAFIDADDLWSPNHLKDLKDLHEDFPDCGLYAKAYTTKQNTKLLKSKYNQIPMQERWRGLLKDYFKNSLINSIAHTSAVAITKSVFEKLNGFNDEYNCFEDIDLWIRIALKYEIAFDNKVSSTYVRNDNNSLTNRNLSQQKFMDFSAYKDYEKTNPSLKNYIDQNRLSLAFQYKLNRDSKKANDFISEILPANISTLQKILLKLPSGLLRLVLKSRNSLRQFGLDLRLFR